MMIMVRKNNAFNRKSVKFLFFLFLFLFLLASSIKLLQLNAYNKMLKIEYIKVKLK
jgi:hypothetical protein